jgi:hypothetical protein
MTKIRKKETEKKMGFWKGECGEYCHGEIVEKRVELHRKDGKKTYELNTFLLEFVLNVDALLL